MSIIWISDVKMRGFLRLYFIELHSQSRLSRIYLSFIPSSLQSRNISSKLLSYDSPFSKPTWWRIYSIVNTRKTSAKRDMFLVLQPTQSTEQHKTSSELVRYSFKMHLSMSAETQVQSNLPQATTQNVKPRWSLMGGGRLREYKNLPHPPMPVQCLFMSKVNSEKKVRFFPLRNFRLLYHPLSNFISIICQV